MRQGHMETGAQAAVQDSGVTVVDRPTIATFDRRPLFALPCYAAMSLWWWGLQEDSMHTQIVMDHTGDTRHHFDANDRAEIAKAEKRFMELTGAGYIAAKRTGVGTSELIHKFDPIAEETLFIPRLIGG
jgi:hypothetical protein